MHGMKQPKYRVMSRRIKISTVSAALLIAITGAILFVNQSQATATSCVMWYPTDPQLNSSGKVRSFGEVQCYSSVSSNYAITVFREISWWPDAVVGQATDSGYKDLFSGTAVGCEASGVRTYWSRHTSSYQSLVVGSQNRPQLACTQ